MAHALITPDEALLITDSRYYLQAEAECPGFEVIQTPGGSGGYGDALHTVLKAHPALRRLGFEADHVTVSQLNAWQQANPNIQWNSTQSIVETQRQIKDAGEIAILKRAIAIAEDAFLSVQPLLCPGTRESDFALELEFAMRRSGASGTAFETIVASGPNGARPHYHAGSRLFQSGDFVTIDWGAAFENYHSDITRTAAIGAVTEKQRTIYAIVLEAQQRAIAAIAPGKNGKEIDAVARDYIASHGYGDAFGHSLGHMLGRSVHDGPGFSQRTEELILLPGMVITVEPGIYLEGWGGIRVEEDILVTETGCEILTHLPNILI